ncbi:MAG TPA: DUF4097 family beta strand repeat-containing protein, partial [Candidatus Angelobacter sp.]|nr:DUF4097 family beta strand repeat-containing protein [Candidatus Angelobacter sp.]
MKSLKLLTIVMMVTGLAALPLQAATTGHFERTLQVNGQVEMEISTGSGNITVHQGGTGAVYIAAKIHSGTTSWLFGGGNVDERIHKIEQNPPIVQQGNIIHIGKSDDRELFRNISVDYDVTVPAQTRLSAYTGSGDQSISGTQLPLTAKTGSGNITIDNVIANARVSSGSGDLKINGIKGFLFAETGSGNIRAGEIAGEVSVSTGSGNIEVHETSTGNVKAGAGSGNIKLYGVMGGLRADSGSGDIHAEGEPKG